MKQYAKLFITAGIVSVAIALVAWKYHAYLTSPWTRDGQLRANVIKLTPRVSGPIVELPIVDNQFVKTGQLLFRIDQRTYQASLAQAQANYDQTIQELQSLDQQIDAARAALEQSRSQVVQAEAQVRSSEASLTEADKQLKRYAILLRDGHVSQASFDQKQKNFDVDAASKDRSDAALLQAVSAEAQAKAELATAIAKRGGTGDDNAQLRSARAALEEARLNLEFTEQKASVDGYVTNLELRLGSQANAGSPAMALIDVKSYWIDAYFKEDIVGSLTQGDRAYVTLMSYPDRALPGKVKSIAWGIAKQDGSTTSTLLPTVQPSFEWIRLAQRIPVQVLLDEVPEDIQLRVGTTASVLVQTGTSENSGNGGATAPPPAPSLLQ